MRTKFSVPQFIDIEDKILGPITVRQFCIVLIDAFVLFLVYKLFDFSFFVVIGIVLTIIGVVLAFVKVNGAPFHFFLLNIVQTSKRPRHRVWNKDLTTKELRSILAQKPEPLPPQKVRKEALTSSRLSELSLVVNTGGVYNPEE